MKRQIKVNKNFAGYKVGQIIDVECDERGNIKDHFWFSRMRDSEFDKCVEFIDTISKKKVTKKHTTED